MGDGPTIDWAVMWAGGQDRGPRTVAVILS